MNKEKKQLWAALILGALFGTVLGILLAVTTIANHCTECDDAYESCQAAYSQCKFKLEGDWQNAGDFNFTTSQNLS